MELSQSYDPDRKFDMLTKVDLSFFLFTFYEIISIS